MCRLSVPSQRQFTNLNLTPVLPLRPTVTIISSIFFPHFSSSISLCSLTLDMADALLALPSSPHYFVLPSPTMSELGCLTEVCDASVSPLHTTSSLALIMTFLHFLFFLFLIIAYISSDCHRHAIPSLCRDLAILLLLEAASSGTGEPLFFLPLTHSRMHEMFEQPTPFNGIKSILKSITLMFSSTVSHYLPFCLFLYLSMLSAVSSAQVAEVI